MYFTKINNFKRYSKLLYTRDAQSYHFWGHISKLTCKQGLQNLAVHLILYLNLYIP